MEAIRTKTLGDFLREDESLMKKISYEEYDQKINAPRNNDYPIRSVMDDFEDFLKTIGQDS